MGRPDTGLLTVTDFDTPAVRTMGLITARRSDGETVYRVAGRPEDLTSITAAAGGCGRGACSLERPPSRDEPARLIALGPIACSSVQAADRLRSADFPRATRPCRRRS